MNLKSLEGMLRFWQERLRLQDWYIKIRFARSSEFDHGSSSGEVIYELRSKQAMIKILDPIDYPRNTSWEQDVEETVVHELLHLHFGSLQIEEEFKSIMLEQAICCIADGLITTKREGSDGGCSFETVGEDGEGATPKRQVICGEVFEDPDQEHGADQLQIQHNPG